MDSDSCGFQVIVRNKNKKNKLKTKNHVRLILSWDIFIVLVEETPK